MKNNILIADDDASIRFVISKSLSRAGFQVRATDNAVTLMKWVKAGEGDVVLSDVHMGQEDIFKFIPELKQSRPQLPVIIMSANTSVMTALKSGKFGVFEYIPKPFDLTDLQKTIERALGADQAEPVDRSVSTLAETGAMIGKSAAMQPVFRGISDFMSGDVPVFIYGDVGTGKNLTAHLLHHSGRRKDQPFVQFSDFQDLFSVLGAVEDGDLFVDRIDDLTTERQSLLLSVLEKNESRKNNDRFRVLSTAGKAFQILQADKKLRPELFSHLRGGQIHLPPLSKRREDIPDLATFFINQNPDLDRKRKFSKAALEILKKIEWYGNVRDLRSLARSIPLQYSDSLISEEIVNNALGSNFGPEKDRLGDALNTKDIRKSARHLLLDALAREQDNDDADKPYAEAMAWIEKPLIEEALKITKGNNVKAAELLGIHRNTLRMKIKSLGINQDPYS